MGEDEVFDTSLLMEGKGKLTTILNLVEYPKALEEEMEVLFPDKRDYYRAIEIMVKLYETGKPIPALDAILAGMCINRKLTLRTRDVHFQRVAEVSHDFKLKMDE
jgi:hypothetical protein